MRLTVALNKKLVFGQTQLNSKFLIKSILSTSYDVLFRLNELNTENLILTKVQRTLTTSYKQIHSFDENGRCGQSG